MIANQVIFVRHGQTDWSLEQLRQGPLNLPLKELGKQTIAQTASYLKTLPGSWIMWSSPYIRTAETADIILKQGVSISKHIVKENIRERYFGDFRLDPQDPPDKETDDAFTLRISQLVKEIEHETQPILIVGHGKVFEKLCALLDVSCGEIGFGEVVHFNRSEGRWKLLKALF